MEKIPPGVEGVREREREREREMWRNLEPTLFFCPGKRRNRQIPSLLHQNIRDPLTKESTFSLVFLFLSPLAAANPCKFGPFFHLSSQHPIVLPATSFVYRRIFRYGEQRPDLPVGNNSRFQFGLGSAYSERYPPIPNSPLAVAVPRAPPP